MPFCIQCGNQVRDVDFFCAKCGKAQAGAAGPRQTADFLESVSPNAASLCCYVPVVGWIACIIVLAAARFRDNREVRFHAFQGLYLFVIWLIVDWVVSPLIGVVRGPMEGIGHLLQVGVVLAWVFMLVKLAQGQSFRLPIIGELAERSVAEQKP